MFIQKIFSLTPTTPEFLIPFISRYLSLKSLERLPHAHVTSRALRRKTNEHVLYVLPTTNYKWYVDRFSSLSASTNIQSSSAVAPGGLRAAAKRKNVADKKAKEASQMPLSTRAAGAGGSSATMLKLFTDEAQGLRVDPLVVLFLAVGFIFSVIVLHVLAKITGKFTS